MKIKNEKIKSYKIFIIKELCKRLFIFYGTIFIIIVLMWNIVGNLYKTVEIPDIINMPINQAINQLRQKNLRYEIDYRSSPNVLENYVMYQYPENGVFVKEGRTVTIILSSGTVSVEIPDLRNNNLLEANRIIQNVNEHYEDIGVRLANITYIYDNNIPNEYVISQTPLPYTKVSDNVGISLLLSKGPSRDKMIMPECVDKNISEVRNIFDSLNINYSFIYKVEKEAEEGTIVSQHPRPLTFIDSTSSITFVITRKTPESQYNVERYILIDYLIPDKLVPVNVKIVITDNKGKHEIYNRKTMSGTKIELSYLVVGNAEMKVYVNDSLESKERIL
jgi:eukaryotic-like serine/threonine-protein kinase